MAPKADAKGAKKKEESEETSSEEEESYEYETESSSEKPAAKKADEKKPAAAAAADAKKPDAKAAAKKEESEEEDSDEEEGSDEYEYETESEESGKKPAAGAAKPAAAAAAKPAAAAAPAKADDKKAAAKKEESEEDEDEDEYEYESEYETESEEKKPAAAAAAKPAAAAAPAKADDKKPAAAAAAAAPAKADDKKPAAAAAAAPAKAGGATTAAAAPAAASREVVMQEHKDPTTAKEHIAMFLGELFGTFFLSYVIFQFRLQMAGVGFQEPTGGIISHALVQAFAVGAVTAAFGHLSQAQFNPAVTLAMVALRQTKPLYGLLFVVLQVAGAVLAGLLAWGLAPPATQYIAASGSANATALLTYGTGYAAPYACTFEPAAIGHSDLTTQCWKQGLGGEIIGTFIFTMVYLLTYVAGHGEVGWLATAAALAVAVFSFHNTSNAYFNPARAIGGAVFTFNYAWNNFWIYIIGPFIGAIMSIIIFGFIFQSKGDKSRGETILRH